MRTSPPPGCRPGPVIVDGDFRRGTDIFQALAPGATAAGKPTKASIVCRPARIVREPWHSIA